MTNLKAIPGGQGAITTSAVEPYPFTPEFERALMFLCASNQDVYSRIGAHLDPKALTSPIAIQLFKAIKAIADDMGAGPSNPTIVIQRLRAWRDDGKLKFEQVTEAADYLEDAESGTLPTAEEVINEVANVIKKRQKRELAKKTLDVTAKNGDFNKLANEAAAIERIGESRMTLGIGLFAGIGDMLVAKNNTSRLPTGCLELDNVIGGGLPKGYTLFMGREKSGKSMVLSSLAAEAIWQGKNVGIATLELEVEKQMERVLANLLNLSLYEVQTSARRTNERLAMINDQVGKLSVVKFAPDTPVNEVTRWAESLAEAWGRLDLLVVDYADLLGAGKVGRDVNAYMDARTVGNTLRDHAVEHRYVTASATQGRRSSGTQKPLDVDDAADSQHKVRVADLVIAMRMDAEDKSLVDWYVILNRDGTDRQGTGQIPTDREHARMFPVSRLEPWR